MEATLRNISKKAIQHDSDFLKIDRIKMNWLGNLPAQATALKGTETRLNVLLPRDYKFFLSITNGFDAPNDVEPSFENVESIDYLRNINSALINAYQIPELEEAIVIAGISEEQYFLLLPPNDSQTIWRYWKFANWIPGEEPYENLQTYFDSVLKFYDKLEDAGK
jgi:hypothetical protein